MGLGSSPGTRATYLVGHIQPLCYVYAENTASYRKMANPIDMAIAIKIRACPRNNVLASLGLTCHYLGEMAK